ncbi:MAG: glycosyltransferase family 2 protein [Bacilli bacterium]|nr:glycosyltransferase family 2 protein [Bacilli bacterium]
MKLSVIIPCHNEEKNIFLFYDEFKNAFKYYKNTFELIFIDDGSKDNTFKELKKLVEKKENIDNIKALSFSRNFGKEAAMYAGLKEAKGDYVCIIDADLQQKPSIILDMIKILDKEKEYDCVCAYQNNRKENRLMTKIKRTFYKIINSTSEVKFVTGASDFRLFRKSVAESIITLGEHHRFLKGIFSYVGFNTFYIPYEVEERVNGKTNWNFTKLVKYAIDGILSFSNLPLKLSLYFGNFIFISSIIYLIVALILKLEIVTTLMFFFIFLSLSIILIFIGITNLYIARIYDEVKSRPNYIIRSTISTEKNNKK